MRNSILGVLGEMISRVLSGEDLDAKQKSTRDQFLDKLEVVHLFIMALLFVSTEIVPIFLEISSLCLKCK